MLDKADAATQSKRATLLLNHGKELWQRLENYVLNSAREASVRVPVPIEDTADLML